MKLRAEYSVKELIDLAFEELKKKGYNPLTTDVQGDFVHSQVVFVVSVEREEKVKTALKPGWSEERKQAQAAKMRGRKKGVVAPSPAPLS